jgi:hypothetical protein
MQANHILDGHPECSFSRPALPNGFSGARTPAGKTPLHVSCYIYLYMWEVVIACREFT